MRDGCELNIRIGNFFDKILFLLVLNVCRRYWVNHESGITIQHCIIHYSSK